MNEANEFYESIRSKQQAVLNWRDGPPSSSHDEGAADNSSLSGNGDARREASKTEKKDGTPFPEAKDILLTQNG